MQGRKVTIPSYVVRVGDEIRIKESKRTSPLFRDLANILKTKHQESWFAVDGAKYTGKVTAIPQDVELPCDINLVVDYYSR